MKKKILGLALLAMSFATFNGMAQTNNTTCASSKSCDKTSECVAKQPQCDIKKAKKVKADPFAGLTLSDAQKAKLNDLKTKRASEQKVRMQSAKADRQKTDSLRSEARKADRREYLEEVKAIIGPDQYVVFLENMVINNGAGQSKAKAVKQGSKQMKGKAPRGNGERTAKRDGRKDARHASARQAKTVATSAATTNS